MFTVVETEEFSEWLADLKDQRTRARLQVRLAKVGMGNLGDHKSLGEDVYELREFFGPAWRMYYLFRGGVVIFMLGGGDKSTQERDIERAKLLAQELKDDQDRNEDQDQDPPV